MGHKWDKHEETLEVTVPSYQDDELVTKRSVLSHLGRIYDPLGIISPTLAEGKRIYREVCEEKRGWNTEVSPKLKYQWLKWTNQLRNVKVPRSINKSIRRMKTVHQHIFADANTLAYCAAAVAVVEGSTGVVKGLQIANIKERYFNSSARTGERLYGREFGEKFKPCSAWMAHYVDNNMDG